VPTLSGFPDPFIGDKADFQGLSVKVGPGRRDIYGSNQDSAFQAGKS